MTSQELHNKATELAFKLTSIDTIIQGMNPDPTLNYITNKVLADIINIKDDLVDRTNEILRLTKEE